MAKVLGMVGVLALVLVIPVTVILIGQNQTYKSNAATKLELESAAEGNLVAEDSYVDSDTPDANFASEPMVWADGVSKKIAYIKLNLTSLAGKNIQSAKLKVFVNYPASSPVEVKVVPVSTWSSDNLTYNVRPLPSNTVVTTINGGTKGEFMEIDLTDFVKQNTGNVVSLALETNDPGGFSINSLDAPFNKPELIVVE